MFPKILLLKRNWICWKYKEVNGRKTKIPYNPLTGKKAKSTDPRTWTTYQIVRKAIGYDGIGYVFNGDGIFGIDIDHCIDEKTNEIKKDIQAIIDMMDSYTEKSPSGKGIHIIGFYKGKNMKSQRKNDIEIYFTGRYFTMSGRSIKGNNIADLTEKIETLRIQNNQPTPNKTQKPRNNSTTSNDKSKEPINLTDNELLEKMFNWKNGKLLKAIYEGENPISNGNISSNDFYLVKSLNFANNNDIIQTDRIFRNSNRMRPKWDERHYSTGETYGQRLLQITQK